MGTSNDSERWWHSQAGEKSILCATGSRGTHEGRGYHLQVGNFHFNKMQDLPHGQKCPEVEERVNNLF